MKITLNIMCSECGNSNDFLEIDCLDYSQHYTIAEYSCNCCRKRICIIMK
jgi:hypothetical protein